MASIEVKFGSDLLRRESAYERDMTSLLLVDMQRIWCEPNLDPTHPQDAESYYHRRLCDLVVPNQKRILDAARAANCNVLHTIIQSLTNDGRDRSLDHKLSDMHVPKDAPEGAVIDALVPIENEIVLPKTSSGVFNSTNIDYVLRNLNTRYLIIAGVVTDQCVDMAVRDASDRGYLVTVVHDACATYTQERHEAALNAYAGYCWITDTDTVLARLNALTV
ncbi:isochorismatase family cysteine hydrolase [Brucella lupini]|jgi:nicotinamidase-related amidase|uniref:Cysteine hydrolase n=1 Tax=Brucella lupini TaxID=255457 RepID=A0A256GZQ0_9HYPH|nr:isochorismatase family cysteine hydrolase [Brucella lupini]KAB2703248.1 cysteine hydrolase [Brucella lupini]OYR32360.1 isochorismatase family protein [Brucella lupini]